MLFNIQNILPWAIFIWYNLYMILKYIALNFLISYFYNKKLLDWIGYYTQKIYYDDYKKLLIFTLNL